MKKMWTNKNSRTLYIRFMCVGKSYNIIKGLISRVNAGFALL